MIFDPAVSPPLLAFEFESSAGEEGRFCLDGREEIYADVFMLICALFLFDFTSFSPCVLFPPVSVLFLRLVLALLLPPR